jgi:hypothetical protein
MDEAFFGLGKTKSFLIAFSERLPSILPARQMSRQFFGLSNLHAHPSTTPRVRTDCGGQTARSGGVPEYDRDTRRFAYPA